MKTYEQFSQKPEVNYFYHGNGQIHSKKWNLNGKFHREDGPAIQKWYENGQKWIENWFLNGERHREDGPALQWWYPNGQKQFNDWYLNGKKHREDGPAFQTWFKNGQKGNYWYLNDINYSREEWIDKLKEIN